MKDGGKTVVSSVKKNSGSTPSDDGGGTVSAGTPLDPNSPAGKRNYGGGTDNNSETASGSTGQLSPNSSVARKGSGDGGGDDAGDNNKVSKGGTLAGGTSLTQKGNGDGGNSDGRGDAGGGLILGKLKVNPGGGDPHQTTATGGAAASQ